MIDTYISYLRDVRRVSPNTVESYARDLAALGGFAEARGTRSRRWGGAISRRSSAA